VNDTIAAISTPRGFGGIGVVRVSGPAALEISNKVFSQKIEKPNFVYVGNVIDPKISEPMDTCVAIFFRAPHSYTGEDVVELQMHGGLKNLDLILKYILGFGARVAEKGEFTKRAVLNGKMDLIQAEAVIELIEAKTEKALKASSKKLFGDLSKEIEEIKSKLVSLLASVEAPIDFPFDAESIDRGGFEKNLKEVILEVRQLLGSYKTGKSLQEGFKVVISGKPNVGKSTLLNALLKFERAIVSETPGTTRDTIEELIDFYGIPIRIIDTAGFRETRNKVEQLGLDRTLKAINESDLILFVFDVSEEISEEDKKLLEISSDRNRILVVNKTDLPQKVDINLLRGYLKGEEIVEISALLKQGIEELEEKMYRKLLHDETEAPLITTEREKLFLERVLSHLENSSGVFEDAIIVEELREALEEFGSLSSSNASLTVMDEIFSKFCIGK